MKNSLKNQVKKVVLVTVVTLGAVVGGVNAQTGVSGSQVGPVGNGSPASVALNVILKPVRTLTVSHDQVNLVYETAADYENGVSHTTTNGHLRVTNIGGGYKIYVKSSAPNLVGGNGNNNTIDGNTVTVSGLAQQGVQAYTRKISEITGGNYGAELFHHSNNANVVDKAYDVKYEAAGNGAYLDKLFQSKETKYTVNVIYTIVSE